MELDTILKQQTEEAPDEAPDEPKPPRYIVRDAAYTLGPHPPIEYVIENLIHVMSVSMFYGEPGSKKTWALLFLAVCVALGKAFLGFQCKPRKVLFIDEEAGEDWTAFRLGAAIRGALGDDTAQVEFVSLAGFKLDDKADAAELEKLILERRAGLVVIDALCDVMDGDENTKKDTQPVFTTLKKIAARTNAAIIIIDHSNRGGGYRGSSAKKGAVDLQVKIESEEGSNWIYFKSEKTRHIEAVKFAAVAYWTEDQFYLESADVQARTKKRNKSQAYVMRYLTEHGPSSIEDIMGGADSCTANAARHAIYTLVDEGEAHRTNPDDRGRGSVAIYELVKRGDDEE